MKIIKHNGNGQTICVGCLAKGKMPLHWDSSIIEIQYESGNKLGSFCANCFSTANDYLHLDETQGGESE